MPETQDVFLPNTLIWTSARNGNPGGINTGTVNLDTNTHSTEQALSSRFTISNTPTASADGLWDSVTFTATITHQNLSGPSADQDIGVVVFRLTDTAGNFVGTHKVSVGLGWETSPAGTIVKTVDITFNDVAPGTYRLFAGETNAGDGEALRLTITEGNATETICFAAGTQIATPAGNVSVQNLKKGDLVYTKDRGPQEILWIKIKSLCPETLSKNENLRPIRIEAGALGDKVPTSDLVVSPQHRILVSSKIVERMFGCKEVLCPAKHLLGLDKINIAVDLPGVSYIHFLLRNHEIVYSNGAETESLYTGPMALKSLNQEQRNEVLAIFPELSEESYDPLACRLILNGRQTRELVECHVNNGKSLTSRRADFVLRKPVRQRELAVG